MAFHIRDPETDKLAREVAARKGIGITEAVREALKNDLRRNREDYDRLKAEVEAMQTPCDGPITGSQEDRAFLDDAWGERK